MGLRRSVHGTVNFGQVTIRYHLWRLEADTDLEASGAPINELDGTLRLERCNSTIYVVWYDISTVQQAGGHVFAVTGVTLHHLVVELEARHGDFLDGVRFVGCLGSGHNRGVGDKRKVDTRVRYQVSLEFV